MGQVPSKKLRIVNELLQPQHGQVAEIKSLVLPVEAPQGFHVNIKEIFSCASGRREE